MSAKKEKKIRKEIKKEAVTVKQQFMKAVREATLFERVKFAFKIIFKRF